MALGRRKPQPRRCPAGASSATQQKTLKTGSKRVHRWHKPLAWSGGVATVVLAGVLVNVLSSQATRVIPQPSVSATSLSIAPVSTALPGSTRPVSSSSARPSVDPLTVVSEDPLDVDNLGNWVLPKSLVLSSAALKSLNDTSSFNAVADYLFSQGGYQDGHSETQLVVQNNQNFPLRVIDIEIAKSCTAPLNGTRFFAPGQASDPSVKVGFDLDRMYPTAVEVPFWPDSPKFYNSAAPYFANYTVSIAPGEQQAFDLFAQAFNHACTFRYKFTILENETKVYQIIGDGPEPFRVSGGSWNGSVMYYLGPCSPSSDRGWARVNPKFNGC